MSDQSNVFEAVGGAAFFERLVERFYAGVAVDPLLRPLYPDDLTESIDHLALFLQQYWGGPGTYSEQRGHPRLRQRHMPFVITEGERDAWFTHMATALDQLVVEQGVDARIEAQMLDYFAQTADFLVNAR
ncbi:MAG: globin domain-containing protein [Microthrixaceae bacterium]